MVTIGNICYRWSHINLLGSHLKEYICFGHNWSHSSQLSIKRHTMEGYIYPGHNWSQLVTTGQSWSYLSHIKLQGGKLGVYLPWSQLVTTGHSWSQLVTDCYLVTAGHIGHFLACRKAIWEEISARTYRQTDGRSPLIV